MFRRLVLLFAALCLSLPCIGENPEPFHPTDIFAIVGATPDMTLEQIKQKYRQAALKFHPDHAAANQLTSEKAEKAFKRIQAAWEFLQVPQNLEVARAYGVDLEKALQYGPKYLERVVPGLAPPTRGPEVPLEPWEKGASQKTYDQWIELLDAGYAKYRLQHPKDSLDDGLHFVSPIQNHAVKFPAYREAVGDWLMKKVKATKGALSDDEVQNVAFYAPSRADSLYREAMLRADSSDLASKYAAKYLAAAWGNHPAGTVEAVEQASREVAGRLRALQPELDEDSIFERVYESGKAGQSRRDLHFALMEIVRHHSTERGVRLLFSDWTLADDFHAQLEEVIEAIRPQHPELAAIGDELRYPVTEPVKPRTAAQWRRELEAATALPLREMTLKMKELSAEARAANPVHGFLREGIGGNAAFQRAMEDLLGPSATLNHLSSEKLVELTRYLTGRKPQRAFLHRAIESAPDLDALARLGLRLLAMESWDGRSENHGLIFRGDGRLAGYTEHLHEALSLIERSAARFVGPDPDGHKTLQSLIARVPHEPLVYRHDRGDVLRALLDGILDRGEHRYLPELITLSHLALDDYVTLREALSQAIERAKAPEPVPPRGLPRTESPCKDLGMVAGSGSAFHQ